VLLLAHLSLALLTQVHPAMEVLVIVERQLQHLIKHAAQVAIRDTLQLLLQLVDAKRLVF
jgi:hypothetical protein